MPADTSALPDDIAWAEPRPSTDPDAVTRLSGGAVVRHLPAADARPRRRLPHERLGLLLDAGSFYELQADRHSRHGARPPRGRGDGVVVGVGTIHGSQVCVFVQDPQVEGGTLGEAHADKIRWITDLGVRIGAPVIGLYDGGGARIQEGVRALDACGRIFQQFVRSRGSVPQISVILGPCAGAAAYAPALTDFVFMVRDTGMMFLTGPRVVETVTSERLDGNELGGTGIHGPLTGLATFVHDDEESSLNDVRYLVSLLPNDFQSSPQRLATDDDAERTCPTLPDLVPADPRQPYDMVSVIEEVVDHDTFLETHCEWGRSMVCGLARLTGRVVGIVANQPIVRAGAIDLAAAEKAAEFVRTCDRFGIPIVTLVDVPGFMPGSDQEHGGVIRRGATLLDAYCSATVPRVQVILRKAFGGGYIVMDATSLGCDLSFAWPSVETGVMGAQSAVEIINRRELSRDPGSRARLEAEFLAAQLAQGTPTETGVVHDLIDPVETRNALASALTILASKDARTCTRGRP
ncbi:MAG: carboxyl transferase domain-containing protein [Knoellia sp.]